MSRRRKWDEVGPSGTSEGGTAGGAGDAAGGSVEAGLSAFIAKGSAQPPPSAPRPSPVPASAPTPSAGSFDRSGAVVTAELGINHHRPDVRALLLNDDTVAAIFRDTEARVEARGVEMSPDMVGKSKERPLYLLISGPNDYSVEAAKNKLRSIIESAKPSSMTGTGLLIAKVFIQIENDPGFGLLAKVLGPRGQYIKHIASDTNTKVQLRGQGSGYGDRENSTEALHIFITAATQESLDKAKNLAEGLVKHVKSDYDKYIQTRQQYAAYSANAAATRPAQATPGQPAPGIFGGQAQSPASSHPQQPQQQYYAGQPPPPSQQPPPPSGPYGQSQASGAYGGQYPPAPGGQYYQGPGQGQYAPQPPSDGGNGGGGGGYYSGQYSAAQGYAPYGGQYPPTSGGQYYQGQGQYSSQYTYASPAGPVPAQQPSSQGGDYSGDSQAPERRRKFQELPDESSSYDRDSKRKREDEDREAESASKRRKESDDYYSASSSSSYTNSRDRPPQPRRDEVRVSGKDVSLVDYSVRPDDPESGKATNGRPFWKGPGGSSPPPFSGR